MLAAPDLALQTLTEFADQVRRITRASDLSLFVDADQGYGNALNACAPSRRSSTPTSGLSRRLVMPARPVQGRGRTVSIDEMKASCARRWAPAATLL
jgi:carboxyvinyl-carboxyphosphonate phosphorylmutase